VVVSVEVLERGDGALDAVEVPRIRIAQEPRVEQVREVIVHEAHFAMSAACFRRLSCQVLLEYVCRRMISDDRR